METRMHSSISRLGFTICFLWIGSSSLFAWSTDGHVIVCKIAETYLKPSARKVIDELLVVPDEPEKKRSISDPRLCTWADAIRSGAVYDKKYPNHRTWHYINIELKVKEEDFKVKEEEDHVVSAIPKFVKVLKNREETSENRKEALLFIIHFVGDMHQPLHCSNRNDDKGGNMQPIKSFKGTTRDRMNLHSVWDDNMVQAEKGELTVDDYVKRLTEEIKEQDRKTWAKGDTKLWAWEAHMFGVKHVYQFTDGKVFPLPGKGDIELTDENYVQANKPIVREQLKKAGVRLAWILNDCFPEK
jgi:hypothetical protein